VYQQWLFGWRETPKIIFCVPKMAFWLARSAEDFFVVYLKWKNPEKSAYQLTSR